MGVLLIATSAAAFLVSQKNRKIRTNQSLISSINSDLSTILQQQKEALLQKDKLIQKLASDNQTLQKIIVEKQNQSATGNS